MVTHLAQTPAPAQAQAHVETSSLLNKLQPLFNTTKWHLSQTSANKVCYNNFQNPLDEYIIETPSTHEIQVSIPINQVAYRNTFFNMNEVINYVKMHLAYYDSMKYI